MRSTGEERADHTTEADDRDPVEALAEEFIERRRRGETPGLDEYAARCPERAEEIRELFPAIAALERWKPAPVPARPHPPRGTARERVGHYRLIREIGRGGMGVVYEAEHERLRKRVAIKVLPGAAWADDLPMQRFLREARTAASLGHPNIVPVFDSGREDDLHYYVMPLIRGAGLDRVIGELRERRLASFDGSGREAEGLAGVARSLIDKPGRGDSGGSTRPDPSPLPPAGPHAARKPREAPGGRRWREVAELGIQVAGALAHAHEQGILHRDVKPANLLIDAEGTVRVTDFGLAKAMGHDDLSRTGDLIGTLRYMAPERFRGESDARGDLYSLGLTLYELATLRPAHEALDRAELLRKIAEAGPTPPRDLAPEIPRDLETVILKAIAADPARRYASAAELGADLARFVEGRSILARRSSGVERLARWIGRNPAVSALAGTTAALAVVAAFFVGLYLDRPPGPTREGPPAVADEVDPMTLLDLEPQAAPPDGFDPGPPPPGPGGFRPWPPPHRPGDFPPPHRPGDFPPPHRPGDFPPPPHPGGFDPDRPPPPGGFRPGGRPFPPPPPPRR